MAKREKIPAERLSADSAELYKALASESNLACALVAGAALEHALTTLLGGFFIVDDVSDEALLSPHGILASFGACSDMALCLGLVTKGMHSNLKNIGKIRNAFAHSRLHITFSDAEITKLCNKLTIPKYNQVVNTDPKEPDFAEKVIATNPRNRFAFVVAHLHSIILLNALSVHRRDKSTWTW